MKKYTYIAAATAIVMSTVSCKKDTEFDNDFSTSGIDVSKFVTIGNSLMQGYQDKGVHNEAGQQENSLAALIAGQLQKATPSMPEFKQPLVVGNGSGYYTLQVVDGELTPVPPEGTNNANGDTIYGQVADPSFASWGPQYHGVEMNNLAISGMRLAHTSSTGSGDKTINYLFFNGLMGIPGNPYSRFLEWGDSPLNPLGTTIEYIDHVKESKATFFTLALGNNDVLSWATKGGENTPTIVGLPDLYELTPVSEFSVKYEKMLALLKNDLKAKGVVATIPQVTTVPFFNTVTLDILKASFADQQSQLGLPNEVWIEDGSGNVRIATSNDLFLLTSSSKAKLGLGIAQNNPMPKEEVLDETEKNIVVNHTSQLNSTIRSLAGNYGYGIVEIENYLDNIIKPTAKFDGIEVSTKFVEGQGFSLDGVHLSQRGYALVANEYIKVINSHYNVNVPLVDAGNYPGVVFPK